jgi:predicted metal-dependent HD superfamily phosphohydrolase
VSAPTTELPAAWQRWVSPDTNRLDGLLTRYRERHRRYHTPEHVAWVIQHVEELDREESTADLNAVVAAAFYHDAIYEPRYPANERASARLAERDLNQLGWADGRIDSVVTMIEATRDHLDPPDIDSSVLFDADLATLGSDPADYEAYAKAVRAEYRHLDDDEWRLGRAQVLRSFLERETIFATHSGRLRWEQAARMNLEAELVSLG